MPPSSLRHFLACSIWLLNLTVSSSTHILSAYIITSVAILLSSIVVSPRSSFTLLSNLLRYSFITSGLLFSTNATSSSMWSNFPKRSFLRFSPSRILVLTNCSKAAFIASSIKCHSSSSSSCTSSIVITSGNLARPPTVISFLRLYFSDILLNIAIYSSAIF